MHSQWVCWGAALVALPAMAQPSAPMSTPSGASVAPAPYVSAFRDYRPWQEPERASWRAANDDAGALGGHMGHVRGNVERMQGASPPAAPPPAKPGPAR
jgi:hypothetical protein